MEEHTEPPAPGRSQPSAEPAAPGGDGRPPAPMRPPGRGRSQRAAGLIAAIVAVAGAGVLIGHEVWSAGRSGTAPGSPSSPYITNPGYGQPYPGSSAPGAPANSAALAAATDPALVDINTTLPYQAAEAAGTGMVLAANGEILTNNHVIEGSGRITVVDVGNGRSYDAAVVGYSRSDDVAVLQLSGASGLETIAAGDSSKVAVGDGVVAVGNAQGAGGTPSYSGGSITAIEQTVTAQDRADNSAQTLTGLFQTNAQVVPGDSGGALVAADAKVIGMVTAGSTGFQLQGNYGYAIPMNRALEVAGEIESGQASSRVHIGATAFLGVEIRTPTSGIAGAEIVRAVPGGPAAVAGLGRGDIITALAGKSIGSPRDLSDVMLTQKPGSTAPVTYLDPSGQPHTISVHLTSGPPQ